MDAKEFATWRKRLGVTQEVLAERWANVTRTTIQNWENGITPIPRAVQVACAVWERRLKQENPVLGPVTLFFADGPMFIDPYGPRRRVAMLQQEPYPSNAAAIARVLELIGRDDFHNPFIIEKSGEDLWNTVELHRIALGEDDRAPTLVNLLRQVAKHIRETSTLYVRSGPRIPNASEAQARQRQIEEVAGEFADLAGDATRGAATYTKFEALRAKLQSMGKFAPDFLVSGIADSFGARP